MREGQEYIRFLILGFSMGMDDNEESLVSPESSSIALFLPLQKLWSDVMDGHPTRLGLL